MQAEAVWYKSAISQAVMSNWPADQAQQVVRLPIQMEILPVTVILSVAATARSVIGIEIIQLPHSLLQHHWIKYELMAYSQQTADSMQPDLLPLMHQAMPTPSSVTQPVPSNLNQVDLMSQPPVPSRVSQ